MTEIKTDTGYWMLARIIHEIWLVLWPDTLPVHTISSVGQRPRKALRHGPVVSGLSKEMLTPRWATNFARRQPKDVAPIETDARLTHHSSPRGHCAGGSVGRGSSLWGPRSTFM